MQEEGLEKYIDHPEWPLCITQRRRSEGQRKLNWNSSEMTGGEKYVRVVYLYPSIRSETIY